MRMCMQFSFPSFTHESGALRLRKGGVSKSQGSDSPAPQGTGANGLGSGKGHRGRSLGGALGGALPFGRPAPIFPPQGPRELRSLSSFPWSKMVPRRGQNPRCSH